MFGLAVRAKLSALFVSAALLTTYGTPIVAQDGQWTVALTKKQAASFEEHKTRNGHKAFALSPDGAWGRSHGYNTEQEAIDRAFSYCRSYMRKRQRDCILFSVNGKQVAPSVVPTKTVKALYKPLKGKDAAAVFGLAPGTFQGNRKTAAATYAAFESGGLSRSGFTRDAELEALLKGRSIMTTNNKAVMIWLGPQGGEHHSTGSSGVLISHFKQWIATPEGLVCRFDAAWDNGNPLNDTCFYIDSISNGQVSFSWGHSINARRKAQLLAGDARFAAAR